jgi:hypothetical protein
MASNPTYAHGPDSQRQAGVQRGEIHRFHHASRIFPSAQRDYWVYVPQQYDPSIPAAVMVSALEYRGYDHCFVAGKGDHDGKHGGAVLPDALRWLWRSS